MVDQKSGYSRLSRSSDPDLFADSDRFEYSETKIRIWIRIIRIIQGFKL
ncbi:hypothetical protein DMN91_008575, partial [Ooceraea biroi]